MQNAVLTKSLFFYLINTLQHFPTRFSFPADSYFSTLPKFPPYAFAHVTRREGDPKWKKTR